MPSVEGEWKFRTFSSCKDLDGIEGIFSCVSPASDNHGRVMVKKDVHTSDAVNFYENEDIYHFAYEDGTRFQPFGTTCYAWTNQSDVIQEQTLASLAEAPFNKVRMCVFPKYYTYNTDNPAMYAYAGNEEIGFDFYQFNEPFFKNLGKRISNLDGLGIQADLIYFTPMTSGVLVG